MEILGRETIYRDGEYVAFPNLARLKDGTVVCAFRHAKERVKEYGRVTHVDPTAKDVLLRSTDDGYTFDPDFTVIADDENISYQDPCLTVLSSGRIIVTYFRWMLVPIGEGPKACGEAEFKAFGRSLFGKYDCFGGGIGYSISDDNGKTWRKMPKISVEGYEHEPAARGNIVEMPEGYLLMPVYGSKRVGELSTSSVLRSDDQGESWYFYADMAFDPKIIKNYLEPNLFLTQSGKLFALLRTQTDWNLPGVKDFDDTYLDLHLAESTDGGKTWGEPYPVKGLFGSSPFHALQMESGKVLLAWGHRKAPFGIRAKLCDAELTDVETAPELILLDDAPDGDLGYPHILERKDGTVMVSYYIDGPDQIRRIEATILRP